jgi:hypothetical protein
MNRTTKHLSKWATAMLAVGVAFASAPISRAGDQPADGSGSQPAAASQPSTATQPATAPGTAAQPPADTQQKLEDLQKQMNLLQEEIAALKAENTPAMKTAALTQPPSEPVGLTNPPAAADGAPKISISSLLGPVTLSGFGDVYYGYDANHPGNNQSGLRFFEAPTNGFSFNMAELILDKPADASSPDSRLGYHVAAGYGQAAKIINGSDAPFSDGSNFFLKEAYLSYLAPVGKGLTITVGKFVTNAGDEVIESNANWNYSRSILFYYAIPFFHFGAKASYTFNPKLSVNASLVNGWNNTEISHASGANGFNSSGLTYGGSAIYTPNMKWSLIENYYGGPVIIGANADGTLTNNAWRHLSDTVISYTMNPKWAFALNGDVGALILTPKNLKWWGVAGYAKYTFNPKSNFAVRYEYYDDTDGYTGVLLGAPGFAQEFTGTYSYNLTSGLLVRGEYRYDFGQQPIFQSGPINFVKEQNTAYVSFVYSFSSANLK